MAAYIGLLILGALGFLILWSEGLLKRKTALFASAALLLAAMLLRGACMDHETLDYQNFLTRWVAYFRDNGGFAALRSSVGNYNLPYLYFLAFFSYLPVRDLYCIKLLSVAFDLLLAWGMLRLVRLCRREAAAALTAFFVTLFLPTVVLNGAYWGQCDSIYAAFAVWSVFFALDGKPVRSMIAIALSFAFKLQAVFIMPVFLVFLFAKKLRWYHLPIFPAVYLVTALPAVIAGRPLRDAVLLYFDQAGSVGSALNYNSSSVFAFSSPGADTALLSRIGIAFAFGFLLLIYVWCFLRRRSLSREALLVATLLICVAVPFFLPHMHDRYFFLADVLSVALAVVRPRLAFVPVCVSFASLLGYHAYLRQRYLLPMRYGAAALLLVIVALILTLAYELARKRDRKSVV